MAAVHPRRRPARPADSPDALLASFRNMSLRSAATFHNPDKPGVATWDPLEASLKARSTTCPKALEDLLIGAGERRTAELLERVDKAIAANSKLALGAVLSEPEVLPVPAFMLTSHDDDDATGGKTQNQNRRHSHSSDSGIGSSVADSDVDAASAKTTGERRAAASSRSKRDLTSIAEEPDTSLSPISTASARQQRALSKYASDQIHKYIVEPILKEPALHDFHPLIQQVPERIGNKDIKTLRELEKTLIFLAPVSHHCCLPGIVAGCSICLLASGCLGLLTYAFAIPAILRANDPRAAHYGHHPSRVRPARTDRSTVHTGLFLGFG